MTALLPDPSSSGRWWQCLAAVAIGEFAWFGLLYPLVPRTVVGAAFLAALPLPVGAYAFAAVKCLFWVSERELPYWIRRCLGVAIAISVGVVVFALVLVAVMFRRGDSGYRWFHGT